MSEPTAEQLLLAAAILRHRPLTLPTALRVALLATGEYVPEEEESFLFDYADSIAIDMVPDGFRYVSRGEVPLLGIGPLELFEQEGSQLLLTKCAVWYGEEALAEWRRRGGTVS
jgi:hypothetical protein